MKSIKSAPPFRSLRKGGYFHLLRKCGLLGACKPR